MTFEKTKQQTNKQTEKCRIVISTDQSTQTRKQNDKHRDHNSQTQVTERLQKQIITLRKIDKDKTKRSQLTKKILQRHIISLTKQKNQTNKKQNNHTLKNFTVLRTQNHQS